MRQPAGWRTPPTGCTVGEHRPQARQASTGARLERVPRLAGAPSELRAGLQRFHSPRLKTLRSSAEARSPKSTTPQHAVDRPMGLDPSRAKRPSVPPPWRGLTTTVREAGY